MGAKNISHDPNADIRKEILGTLTGFVANNVKKNELQQKVSETQMKMQKRLKELAEQRNDIRSHIFNYQKSQQTVMKTFFNWIQQHMTELWTKYSFWPVQCRNVWCSVAKKHKKNANVNTFFGAVVDSAATACLLPYEFAKVACVATVDAFKQLGPLTTVIDCVSQAKRKYWWTAFCPRRYSNLVDPTLLNIAQIVSQLLNPLDLTFQKLQNAQYVIAAVKDPQALIQSAINSLTMVAQQSLISATNFVNHTVGYFLGPLQAVGQRLISNLHQLLNTEFIQCIMKTADKIQNAVQTVQTTVEEVGEIVQSGDGKITYDKVVQLSDEIIDGVKDLFLQTIRTEQVKMQWNITERLDSINKQIAQYQSDLNYYKRTNAKNAKK